MDAAKGLGVPAIKGHGWPLYAGPRSSDGTRGVERSETRMVGQELIQIHQGKPHPQSHPANQPTKKTLSQFNPHPIHPTVTSICFRAHTHWREPATETS